jgi:hypothetical protein
MADADALRQKAEQARRLATGLSDHRAQVMLRKYADECVTRADELEHDRATAYELDDDLPAAAQSLSHQPDAN